MGKAISKLKKNSRGKSENESGAALTYDDTSDFDEDSGSSASWVTTLPSRNSTMSCPTDESSSNEPTTENVTEESGVTPSNQSYAEASSAKTSSPAPTLLSSELLTELTKLAREGTASAPPPTPEKASTNPFTPSTITEDESYSTSISQSTCRSSNTSADYSALRAIDYNSQPGEARMHDSDFEWIEAVEGFLTEEVIRRSVVPTRPPVFAIRGRKPTPYGQNYRTLYRNMLNKQGNKEV
ncbi:hypothetical protein L596_014431 [Steinernema carpocapsae]|uniref:Uncharacterized protein n=1 Tax=Steinernema carpocapsae TaxID=34508 RepID=A0A4U5NBZ5_STECR|nr:hypothetical protein L596_014431 [Steinernema carpocapsae]